MENLIKMIWKGEEPARKMIKGEGFSATLHFIPGKEIDIPEGALKKLADDILCERLVPAEKKLEEKKEKSNRNRFHKESSITDSEEV